MVAKLEPRCRYGFDKIPAVLPKVQKGDSGQRGTTENGRKQRARRISAEPASQVWEAGSAFYSISSGALDLRTASMPSIAGISAAASFSLHSSMIVNGK